MINFTNIKDDNYNEEWYKLNDEWNKIYIDNENIKKVNHNEYVDEESINTSTTSIENNIIEEINITSDEEIIEMILNKEIIVNKKYKDEYLIEMIKDLNILINYIYLLGYDKNLISKKLSIFHHMILILSYFNIILNIPILNRRDYNSLCTSSYKFCQKNKNCNLQYPDNIDQKISCNYTHYHFNLLQYDIEKMINYLSPNVNKSKLNNITDLFIENTDETIYIKYIQTLKYVINNMYRELTSVITYYNAPITFILRKSRR